jgi:leader peptidase (prepilin peptidase)/N-methyltransferase
MMFVLNAIIFSILIVIFVYDLYHKIIPDALSYSFAVLALIYTIIFSAIGDGFSQNLLLDILAGPLFFFPFWALWFLSKGNWIGLGDGKLAIGIGWFLGLFYGLSAIVLAFWIGAVIGILILLIDKLNKGKQNITMKYEVPFAPFLIIGILIEFFFKLDVMGISFILI